MTDPARTATPPSVSVIVACSRPDRLAGLAGALAVHAHEAPCELVVAGDVAHLPSDGWPVPTRLVPVTGPHPNERRAAAVATASGPILAFLDDDALPEPGWLATAAALAPDAAEVWTGPERPLRCSPDALLAHALSCSWWSEATRAHTDRRDHAVSWSDVPFCNLVTTRSLLERVGPPSSAVPWDADDFEWCDRARRAGAAFRNRPTLCIRHDRYPDDLGDWLARKVRERRRTGEKLVTHPELYLRVPGVVVAAATPAMALVALATVPRPQRSRAAAIGVGAYLALVATVADGAARRASPERPRRVRAAAALVALHASTIPVLHLGILRGLTGRAAAPPWRESPGGSARRRAPTRHHELRVGPTAGPGPLHDQTGAP